MHYISINQICLGHLEFIRDYILCPVKKKSSSNSGYADSAMKLYLIRQIDSSEYIISNFSSK